MADDIVLVNGLPGSGKTALAYALGEELDAQVLSQDELSDALADAITAPEVVSGLAAVALRTALALAGATTGTAVVDAWWYRPSDRDLAAAELTRLGVPAVEVWCTVPPELARERLRQRASQPHRHDQQAPDDWDASVGAAEPLGLTPVIRVATAGRLDVPALASTIRAQLALGP